MASTVPQMLFKDSTKAMGKAAGGWERPPRTLTKISFGTRDPVTEISDLKTKRSLAKASGAACASKASTTAAPALTAKPSVGNLRATALRNGTATATATPRIVKSTSAIAASAASTTATRTAAAAAASRPTTSSSSTAATASKASGAGRAAVRASPAVSPAASTRAAFAAASSPAGAAANRSKVCPAAPTAFAARRASTTTSRSATSSPCAPTANGRCSPSSSPSSSSPSSAIQLPLFLDPRRPNSAAPMLKAPMSQWDSGVLLVRRRGAEGAVAKQIPFHSARRAALLEARLRCTDSAAAEEGIMIVTEKEARREAATIARLPGIFVQPLMVVERPYSRETDAAEDDNDTLPDREIIAVFPYYPSGDAGQYIDHVATPLLAAFKAGKRSLQSAVKELAGMITRIARDMFSLVGQAHKRGYVLDHKLENMVYDHVKARWQLIDAAEVRPCELGKTISANESRGTPFYAAPEQADGLWADSRSDMYSCGRCILMAVSDVRDRLAAALDEQPEELEAAEKALGQVLKPLAAVMIACCNEDKPAARPSAALALRRLG
ncbi:hypothetical protein PLESTB_000129500 [Pleodorina starrii]|uniref:Protein kinase domain-containing protein n=1 Tax=Pleodorina starrii TaxID=330485 RepID=A0A9W6EY56_9CHLO|nr:hypothetical protein PLESTM_000488700 [Pleodorina starrii]GLC48721.1 hypothetical protein PLESTB_000129500 [Pleodorina starrii]GLC74273.1 hypothetical protein PLESTF_001483500 [Pleodorina starrii]